MKGGVKQGGKGACKIVKECILRLARYRIRALFSKLKAKRVTNHEYCQEIIARHNEIHLYILDSMTCIMCIR